MCKIKTKNLVAVTIFILTFAIGVGFAFLHVLQKYSTRPLTQPTSICATTQNRSFPPKSENTKYVHLVGNLYGKDFFHFTDVKRNACEDDYAELVFADEQKLSVESQNLLREISRLTDEENTARAKVEIVGILEERTILGITQSRFVLTAIQITPTGSLEILDRSALVKEDQESR